MILLNMLPNSRSKLMVNDGLSFGISEIDVNEDDFSDSDGRGNAEDKKE